VFQRTLITLILHEPYKLAAEDDPPIRLVQQAIRALHRESILALDCPAFNDRFTLLVQLLRRAVLATARAAPIATMVATTAFHLALLLATLLCSLVAGFLLAFAIVVMPGIARLDDGGFLRAFQVIDRVIQQSQPLFVLVWVGSVMAAMAAAVLGLLVTGGPDRALIVAAALVYLAGVQLPTAAINIPLNNRIQALDVAAMAEAQRRDARQMVEARWNGWNAIRTAVAVLVAIDLMVVLLRA
jgi:uncharacterized membrane protein